MKIHKRVFLSHVKTLKNTDLLSLFKNWMIIVVLLCENERQRWDASQT